MGVTLEQAVLIRDWSRRHHLEGPVFTLGRQQLNFSERELEIGLGSEGSCASAIEAMNASDFFTSCGLGKTISVDISDYEGADIQFDLNSDSLPEKLASKAGLVVNGGTLEHVFHVPNALTNISKMLKPQASIIHILPCHNTVDHGFYQFGPTLIFDYYSAAKFAILEFAEMKMYKNVHEVQVAPIGPGSFGAGLLGALDDCTILLIALVRKTSSSLDDVVPTQRLYSTFPKSCEMPRWFAPYTSISGRAVASSNLKRLRLGAFAHSGGHAWSCAVDADESLGDDSLHPVRSRLALFENGNLLSPPHTIHDEIKRLGNGSYSHWGGNLFFSASDSTNPNDNGYTYEALIPTPIDATFRQVEDPIALTIPKPSSREK